eukprot:m.106619 g.106619  ORF g.106619 m.106619 type:complete len:88 (+) comp15304_c0_seq28:2027-2290(+)
MKQQLFSTANLKGNSAEDRLTMGPIEFSFVWHPNDSHSLAVASETQLALYDTSTTVQLEVAYLHACTCSSTACLSTTLSLDTLTHPV